MTGYSNERASTVWAPASKATHRLLATASSAETNNGTHSWTLTGSIACMRARDRPESTANSVNMGLGSAPEIGSGRCPCPSRKTLNSSFAVGRVTTAQCTRELGVEVLGHGRVYGEELISGHPLARRTERRPQNANVV